MLAKSTKSEFSTIYRHGVVADFVHSFFVIPEFSVCRDEFGWLRSSVFIAFFSDTSSRGNPRVPSGLCSLHLLPSLFLFDIESLPPQTMKLQLLLVLGSRNTDL